MFKDLKSEDVFFFNDTATTEIYTLSLHDALPICHPVKSMRGEALRSTYVDAGGVLRDRAHALVHEHKGVVKPLTARDRKSTRLNSSHANISYAVFCLKKNNSTILPAAILGDRSFV